MTEQAIATTGIEPPQAGTYVLDQHHATAAFVARHLMITKVRGSFRSWDATVHIAERPEDSRVEASFDAASIDTGSPDRDAHLRSPDFLDVERHPQLHFRSTRIEPGKGNEFTLHGELTVRDATKPVVLHATYDGRAVDPYGNTKIGFTASTEIDREDWGLTWNVALESGGVLVSKKVRLEFEFEAIKQ
jgi:polyisoprenoid-binding protein YceI